LVIPVSDLALYFSKQKEEINLKITCHHKNKTKIKIIIARKKKIGSWGQVLVAHTYNPSYLEG
jgi:hypothetical protein